MQRKYFRSIIGESWIKMNDKYANRIDEFDIPLSAEQFVCLLDRDDIAAFQMTSYRNDIVSLGERSKISVGLRRNLCQRCADIVSRCSTLVTLQWLVEGPSCCYATNDDSHSMVNFIATQYRIEKMDDFNYFESKFNVLNVDKRPLILIKYHTSPILSTFIHSS